MKHCYLKDRCLKIREGHMVTPGDDSHCEAQNEK